MIYSVFHLLKQYQQTAPDQIEHLTLAELNKYVADLREEEMDHDLSCSYRSSYGSNGSR